MAKSWQYKMLKLTSRFLCKLSYGRILHIGRALAPIYRLVAKKQEKRVIDNMIRAFSCSREDAEKMAKTMFLHLTQTIVELFYTPRLTEEFVEAHIEIKGFDYLEKAIDKDRGIIVLTAHIGNWEWLGATMASYGHPTTTIVKNQPNEGLNTFLKELRENAGLEVFARDGADIIRAAKAMKQKKMLGFLADQDGGPQGMPIRFLGQMGSAPMGPAIFAKRFQAPILPVFITRKDGGHIIEILEPFMYEDTGNVDGDLYALTERCVKVTEKFIQAHPTEWLWFQHRWKTRPEEIENFENKIAHRGMTYEEE